MMRILAAAVAAALTILPGTASAQWIEYRNIEDRFSINFPTEPTVEAIEFESEDGNILDANRYTAEYNGETYTVTVVDYAQAYEPNDTVVQGSMAWAAWRIRDRERDGDLTLDAYSRMDRIPGHQLQITRPDGSKLFVQIVLHQDNNMEGQPRRLYIAEAVVPQRRPPPAMFQQSIAVLDENGDTVRYEADLVTRVRRPAGAN